MIYQAAGIVGLSRADLRALTWRQLDDMEQGRRLLAWDLVADLKAFMGSCHGAAFTPAELNPERVQMERAKKPERRMKPSEVMPDGSFRHK